jgi:hypothetical protein
MLCQPLAGWGGAAPRSVLGRFSGVKGCCAIAARRLGLALDPGASAAVVGQVWAGQGLPPRCAASRREGARGVLVGLEVLGFGCAVARRRKTWRAM